MAGKKSDKYSPNSEGGFGTFLYNSETGQILGRTCGSWFKITVFYIIFYACLAAFFYLCYQIFATTLNLPEDGGSPKWTLDSSLVGSNPGVGFRPMPDQDKNSESTLIWYNRDKDSKFWSNQLKKFIEDSNVPPSESNVIDCSLNQGASAHRVCRVPVNNLGECNVDNEFGYPEGKPCILIKLNKIFDWEPEPFGVRDGKYNAQDLEDDLNEVSEGEDGLPEDMKDHILQEVKNKPGQEVEVLKTVWISCSGENVGDKENLPSSSFIYKPLRGIPGYFYPYKNQKNYKTPFMMVQLNVPQSSYHTLINVECRAWARNIKYERQSRLGSVHFEILVD